MKELGVRSQWPYAVGGLLAAGAGMALGHLVAAFVSPSASPVLAVGSAVIDATPTPVKEWAVQTLGTADKPVLLASVAAVTAAAAAAIGLVSRRRPALAQALLVLLAALAGLAAMTRPAAAQQDLIPTLAAAGSGAVALAGLRRLAVREQPAPESPLVHTAYAAGSPPAPPRRAFLVGAAGIAAGTAATGALGQRLAAPPTLPVSVTLPAPQIDLPALPAGIEGNIRGVSAFRTPVKDFYRIDTALVIPRVDATNWRLEIGGQVDRPFSIDYRELLAMPMVEKDITLNCVSNEVGGPYISSTRWLGVPVRDLLERAGVRPGVDQILSESTDGMTISTPIEALTDDREALVAVAMDGQPLPARNGFPARLVTPGLYGYVGATKWLAKLTATSYAAEQAYWTKRGWAERALVKTQSRIDTPQGLGTYDAGKVAIGGVAWAQGRGIERVEVSVDGGGWQEATLGPDAGTDYWRQWYVIWDATPGRHELTARATDGTGAVQTQQYAEPFPSGASGYHSVVVQIA
jgi:DMSO/TMAO reductase YedYZ molybdopterin-dependent catalytic subunit